METTQTVGTNTFATNYFVYGATTSVLTNSLVSVVAAAVAKKDEVVVTTTNGTRTEWSGNSNVSDITPQFQKTAQMIFKKTIPLKKSIENI